MEQIFSAMPSTTQADTSRPRRAEEFFHPEIVQETPSRGPFRLNPPIHLDTFGTEQVGQMAPGPPVPPVMTGYRPVQKSRETSRRTRLPPEWVLLLHGSVRQTVVPGTNHRPRHAWARWGSSEPQTLVVSPKYQVPGAAGGPRKNPNFECRTGPCLHVGWGPLHCPSRRPDESCRIGRLRCTPWANSNLSDPGVW